MLGSKGIRVNAISPGPFPNDNIQENTLFMQELKKRTVLGRYGLPEVLVSDNGTQFKNPKFARFTRDNGIQHIFTPPYHPASNGAAESVADAGEE